MNGRRLAKIPAGKLGCAFGRLAVAQADPGSAAIFIDEFDAAIFKGALDDF
ncbi:MAG: hypothetical protein Q8M24_04650 [Pseudolabrys sp.]|nr:hypothetical protein [Pseudolabrys sp.]MDP2294735.1 hypothetical protein [Pseudolabrys sp.]